MRETPRHVKIKDANAAQLSQENARVTSTYNNRTHPTQNCTSCATRNIIYLIECTKCTKGNQYVGQTSRPLRTRIKEHRTNSKKKKTNLPLYRHFLQRVDHNFERDIRVTILQATTRKNLLETEQLWINALDTTYPRGLNSQFHYQTRTS